MKTQELAVYSIQCNMLGAVREGNRVKVLLNNGDYLIITCKKQTQAIEIISALLDFSPVRTRNSHWYEFPFKLKYTTDL